MNTILCIVVAMSIWFASSVTAAYEEFGNACYFKAFTFLLIGLEGIYAGTLIMNIVAERMKS